MKMDDVKEIVAILSQAKPCPKCNDRANVLMMPKRSQTAHWQLGLILVCQQCGMVCDHIHTNLYEMVDDWNRVCEREEVK